MKHLVIEDYENLEDIEIALNKEIIVTKNEFNDFYIKINNGKVIIDKAKSSDKYIVDLCCNGFICENPNIRNLYENKEFSKDELINFIRFLDKEINNKNTEKIIDTKTFINKSKNYFILEGINIEGYSTFDDCGDYELEKNIRPILIVYLKNSKNELYRIIFYETFGMCGSGYCSSSWGNVDIMKIDNLPDNIFYTPKEILKVQISQTIDFEILLKISTMEGQIGEIGNNYDGGDSYYPSGFIHDSFGFAQKESFIIKELLELKNKFYYKKEEIEEYLNLQERIEYKVEDS